MVFSQFWAGTDPVSWALGLSPSDGAQADFHDHSTHDHSSGPSASLPHDHGASGHEVSEGLVLQPGSQDESVSQGALCDPQAPVRSYDVVAVAVDITLNRYLDHDPRGLAYVLETDLPRLRQEEAQNAKARAGDSEPAVSIGLQGDAIQPLALRVNQGECLRITLRNDLPNQHASLHLHGSSLYMPDTGAPAIATNADSYATPGQTVSYQWMVAGDEPEGIRYFHSHGDDRLQTSHGLFGAVVVEPKDSVHLDPLSGNELTSGWSAIIRDSNGVDFREFVLFYHEIGNEDYKLLNKAGGFITVVDPFTSAYRPAARALNYRSEPFMNRLSLQQSTAGLLDESVAYSSYVFGDPATPILRSYLGDPVKERVVHAGSEVSHVHHVHGGSIRWRRQPGVEPSQFNRGLDKHPPLLPEASERIDSQSIGPSESFDVENECGSGGCQQSAGDFLIHCHVAHHYFAGMWGLWRVYNTLQDGPASTDTLPPLRELADREDKVAPAVTSDHLVGKTVDWSGKSFNIDEAGLAEWVERQLPPQGLPKGYDASVLDWRRDGNLYLNEEETTHSWPGYQPGAPGSRPPLLFDPNTGKLAYPMLRPHLAKRPPFAPGHGPSPFLDPITGGVGPPLPGDNGPASICPAGTVPQEFAIHAITVPVTLNEKNKIVDPQGQLFVLKSEEDAVRADNDMRTPLAIRANASEDCVDILLKNELQHDAESQRLRKVNAHIHFVQFDVQASDGVIAGFNYEQSVLPFTTQGEKLTAASTAGALTLELASADRFQPGILVGIGMDQADTFEVKRIAEIQGNTLVFTDPLAHDHATDEIVSTEFVRYRWYPDVQFGAAYFHDHVNALESWRHGLYGAFVSEPPGSSYHHPQTGQPLRSGPIADIRTDSKVSADVTGSFREMVLFIHDESPPTHAGRSSGSLFNLRAEPLDKRRGDPSQRFSSALHGDPETPILNAYLGDPVVLRALVGGTNDVHTLHVDGHWFRIEPYSSTSPPAGTVRIGISERYDLVIPSTGGPQNLPGDYLYYNGRSYKLREGSWGLLRVLDGDSNASLQPLPGREPSAGSTSSLCPFDAPVKHFNVSAVDASLPMLGRGKGKVYVLQDDREAVLSGARPAEPLVLHVNVGDCMTVDLTNHTQDGPVSFHADMLAYDPLDSYGVEAGNNPPQAVAPGQTRRYTFYAHPQVGETVAMVRDWGDVLENPGLGLYGAIVVGPPGAAYRHPVTGEDLAAKSSWQADVFPRDGQPYRDFALFFQDEDDTIGTHRMPYTTRVQGTVGVNYTSEPLDNRGGPAFQDLELDKLKTPLLRAYAGDAVKLRVLLPWSEQAQVFSIEGHTWPFEPGRQGATRLSSTLVGGIEALTLPLDGGAGGRARLPGDYLYGNHRLPYQEAGMWGVFQVLPSDSPSSDLLSLGCLQPPCDLPTSPTPDSATPTPTPGNSPSEASGGATLPYLLGGIAALFLLGGLGFLGFTHFRRPHLR